MKIEKQCKDFYGERLNIGDEVIPVMEEALINGTEGLISKIVYNEEYKKYFITLSDKSGNTLLENANARNYTTQERFDERELQNNVYSLTFYDDSFLPLTNLPLTNNTDLNYEIPEGTCFVVLSAEHLKNKVDTHLTFTSSKIYYFMISGKLEPYNEGEDFCQVINPKTLSSYFISQDYRFFKNEEEFKKNVKDIIAYFNRADMTYVNNNIQFSENEDGKKFERNLILMLKYNRLR